MVLDHDIIKEEELRRDRLKRVQVPLRSSYRALILAVMLIACGRQSGLQRTTRDGGQGGSGGYAGGSGGGIGDAIQGGGGMLYIDLGIGGSTRGKGGSSGSPLDSGGVDAEIMLLSDGACGNEKPLWDAITIAEGAQLGYCRYTKDGGLAEAYVILDDEGQVIYSSAFCNHSGICSEVYLQEWLSSLARYRWPCLAGQTIQYNCAVM